ncbi:hypothetical protein BGZ83_000246 [Gryganskiella cystojenkinii]|nr:hypothetical protein BGZ83_000246 [Gryganskiella cystojenkinii]
MSQSTSPSPSSPPTRPRVLIVRPGLGGLSLVLLLEKTGMPYMIFERTATIKSPAMAFGPVVAPLFRQLGIYEDVFNAAIPSTAALIGGSKGFIIAHAAIHNACTSSVPQEKLFFNKRIISIQDSKQGVRIACSNDTEYEGDIVVGTDGANSAVCQNLYRPLKEKDLLPPSDDTGLPYSYVCLVGQTSPLDPSTLPELEKDLRQSYTMCGLYAVSTIQDAVCLANWINVLPSNTITDIDMIFREYYDERHPMVESLYKYSKLTAASGSKSWKGIFVRYFFTNLPKWLWLLLLKKKIEYRPQISFLPAVEDLGTVPPAAQPSFIKTRAILQEMKAQASAARKPQS